MRREPEFRHAIAQGVAGDTELLGGPRDVATSDAQRLDDGRTLGLVSDLSCAGLGGRAPVAGGRPGARRAGLPGDGQAQPIDGDDRRVARQHDPLHHVRQLAHVARPAIGEQRRPGIVPQRLRQLLVALGAAPQIVLGQGEDVAAALAQWR